MEINIGKKATSTLWFRGLIISIITLIIVLPSAIMKVSSGIPVSRLSLQGVFRYSVEYPDGTADMIAASVIVFISLVFFAWQLSRYCGKQNSRIIDVVERAYKITLADKSLLYITEAPSSIGTAYAATDNENSFKELNLLATLIRFQQPNGDVVASVHLYRKYGNGTYTEIEPNLETLQWDCGVSLADEKHRIGWKRLRKSTAFPSLS